VSDADRRARFAITLADAAGPGASPVEIRLRMALKRLLRTYALKCEAIRELTDKDDRDEPREGGS